MEAQTANGSQQEIIYHRSLNGWRRAIADATNLKVNIVDELVSGVLFETSSLENLEPTHRSGIETRRVGFDAVVKGVEHIFAASYTYESPLGGNSSDHIRRLHATVLDAFGQNIMPTMTNVFIENEGRRLDAQALNEVRAFRDRRYTKGFLLHPLHELPLAS